VHFSKRVALQLWEAFEQSWNSKRFCEVSGTEADRTKFGYSQENEPLGRIALRKYRDRTTENGVL
jgi:hypothetical protein